jgi:hypothetical protein
LYLRPCVFMTIQNVDMQTCLYCNRRGWNKGVMDFVTV